MRWGVESESELWDEFELDIVRLGPDMPKSS